MKLESTKVIVNAQQETVFTFLKDSTNLIHLLPTSQISDWKATETECSFKVQGGITIPLIQSGNEGFSKLFMKSGEKAPFPFMLTIHLNEQGNQTEGYIEFDGEVNMFLKMIIEKPLTALFNIMSEKLKTHFEK
jgi:hypothetical protein